MKRFLIALAMLSMATAQAQAQTIKPGLWELNNTVKTGDLCWGPDNAVLSLGSSTVELL